MVVLLSWYGGTSVKRLDDGSTIQQLPHFADSLRNATFSASGRYFAGSAADGSIYVWETSQWTLRTIANVRGEVALLRFSADDKFLLVSTFDNDNGVWDIQNASKTLDLGQFSPGSVTTASINEDSSRVIVQNSLSNFVKVTDIVSGPLLLDVDKDGVFSVVASADGRWLAGTASDGDISLWDLHNRAGKRVLNQHAKGFDVILSPDSRSLAAPLENGTINIWDTETATVRRSLRGHSGPVYGASFSPDGSQMVSYGQDGTVRVWDLTSGEQLAEFDAHPAPRSVAFSTDRRRIVTHNGDQTLSVYSCELCVSLADVVKLAHTHVTRELTPGERLEYLHASELAQPRSSVDPHLPQPERAPVPYRSSNSLQP